MGDSIEGSDRRCKWLCTWYKVLCTTKKSAVPIVCRYGDKWSIVAVDLKVHGSVPVIDTSRNSAAIWLMERVYWYCRVQR